MATYDGRSGSSQKIQPGWGMDQWGVRMQRAEQDRMAKIAMKLAMSSAGGEGGEFDNPSGFEEGDLQFGTGEGEGIDLEDFGGGGPLDDLDYLEPDVEDHSFSASGKQEGDGFFADTDPNEVTAEDVSEASYDMLQDDQMAQADDEKLKTMYAHLRDPKATGERLGVVPDQQAASDAEIEQMLSMNTSREQIPPTDPRFGAKPQDPRIAMMLQEEQQRRVQQQRMNPYIGPGRGY